MTIDPKEMINGVLNAIGSMAEINFVYYQANLKAGFSQNEAFELTRSFAREITRMAFTPKEKNDD